MLLSVAAPSGTPATGFPIETTVRDALYDRIPLSQPEIALISTPEFGRLERIQQLGFVSRVWPGARHTRFEHSLGVMYLTRLAVDHLRNTQHGGVIGHDEERVAVAAALLHDLGHYPFSHAIEELGPPIVPHEGASRRIIESSPIAGILEARWEVDPHRVAGMIDPSGGTLHPADRLLRGVLSGALDMDKLDYLPRDARACNVPYGGVDTDRLIDALAIGTLDGADRNGEPTIMVDEKG